MIAAAALSATRPRAIFFGTPEFALPALRALCEVADVQLVITQPDRPSGRGMKVTPPPVKVLAEERGLPVIQPKAVRTAEFAERLRAIEAEIGVVIAYGRILPTAVLDAPRLGCVNVHASLLPKLRGAAPIQWAILRGERVSGVCLMQMDEGMDTGPVLARAELAIGPDETAGELSERLSRLGAELLERELPRHLRGDLAAQPQDDSRATLAPLLKKEDGRVDWLRSAPELHDLVRGMHPWPGAFTYLSGERLKLQRARVLVSEGSPAPAGSVVRADRHGIEVACGAGVLALLELQPEGKRRLTAEQFLAAARLPPGTRFATDGP